MVYAFRRQKILHSYKVFLDSCGSDTVGQDDFMFTYEKICEARGWDEEDHPKRLQLEEYMSTVWVDLWKHTRKKPDDRVSKEEWVDLWDDYAMDPSSAPSWQKLFCECVFWLQDAGGDGEIDAEEFASIHEFYGIDRQKAVEAFNKMAQGKKSVKFDEFQKLFDEYFVTEDDEAPGNFVFASN